VFFFVVVLKKAIIRFRAKEIAETVGSVGIMSSLHIFCF
jgi:hypothetical protein